MITLDNRGVSLIEFIIYFALILVVVLITINLSLSMTRVATRERSITEVNQNLRLVNKRFSQAMRAGSGTVLQSTGSACTGADSGSTLKICSLDSNNPTYIRRDTTLGYGRVQISQTVASPVSTDFKDLTSDLVDVTALTFTKVTNGGSAKLSVQMSITLKYKGTNAGELKYYQVNSQTSAGLLQ